MRERKKEGWMRGTHKRTETSIHMLFVIATHTVERIRLLNADIVSAPYCTGAESDTIIHGVPAGMVSSMRSKNSTMVLADAHPDSECVTDGACGYGPTV